MKSRALRTALAALVLAVPARAATFAELESKVQKFTLPNGLTFLVLERHEAPVFSFRTYVDAGGVDEVPGVTGIAHMFEHMAFKGTKTVGTKDYKQEEKAMVALDEAWGAYEAELVKGAAADSSRLAALDDAFKKAQAKAKEFVETNEFSRILEQNGVQGLNASTFTDWTQYYYSLPSNRLELWARLEGDRLTNPVLREFYSERDVVYEERRFSESSPTGRLFLDWINSAYQAHPYGIGGVIGHSSDVKRLTTRDAWDFYRKYYVASNMTIAVVGDVKFDEVKKLAEKYFSEVAAGADPPPLRTVEPRHDAEIRIIREEDAQPVVVAGYHIVSRSHPDWFACELLGDILGSGRTSRLYERLVKKDKVAAQTGAGANFLGTKYPTMLIVQALVAKDATTGQVEAATYEEIDRLVKDGPSEAELDKVKTRAKAAFIRSLRSNNGLAGELAQHEEMLGNWSLLFDYVDGIEAVTPADVQRVAREHLRSGNRVVGLLERPSAPTTAQAGS
jgi:predicted Zn-dependent peptidase